MPNKSKKKNTKSKIKNEMATTTAREDVSKAARGAVKDTLAIGPALILLAVKFLVVIFLLYFAGIGIVTLIPAVMVMMGNLFGIGYESQVLDIISILGLPGVFVCICAALVWFEFAKALWVKLVVKAFIRVKEAIA